MHKSTYRLALTLLMTSLWPGFALPAQSGGVAASIVLEEPLRARNANQFIEFPFTIVNSSSNEMSFTLSFPGFTPQLFDDNDAQHRDLWLSEKQRLLAEQPTEVTVGPRSFSVKPGESVHEVYYLHTRRLALHSGSYTLVLTIEDDHMSQTIVSAPLRFQVTMAGDTKPVP